MQQSRRQLSLLNQLRVVLMSYLTRPGLQWAALAIGAGLVIYSAAVVMAHANGHDSPHGDPVATLLAVVGSLTIGCGVVGFLLIFLFHARLQLIGWPARIFSHTRTANLIVAGGALTLFAASFALLSVHPYSHLFGLFILYFGLLILAGYAFARPWLLVVLIVGGWLAIKYTSLELQLNAMTVDREYVDTHRGSVAFPTFEVRTVRGATPEVHEKEVRLQTAALLARLELDYQLLRTQRLATFLGEVLALLGLGALARPSHPLHGTILRWVRSNAPGTASEPNVIPMREHSFITSRLSRSLHRRFAAHDWRAGAVAALAMGVLSIWFNLQFRVDMAIPMLTMMLAFLPGALVAVGWRERWPTFEFESLYPVSRRELVSDMAVGLMMDVAEFWTASVIAVVIVCGVLRTQVLHDPCFPVALLMGGMMQFLWLGGIFFVGQRRQLSSYVAGLTPGVVAMFLPLEAIWQSGRAMPATLALLIALSEMGVGLILFLLTWAVVQRNPRTEASRAEPSNFSLSR